MTELTVFVLLYIIDLTVQAVYVKLEENYFYYKDFNFLRLIL